MRLILPSGEVAVVETFVESPSAPPARGGLQVWHDQDGNLNLVTSPHDSQIWSVCEAGRAIRVLAERIVAESEIGLLDATEVAMEQLPAQARVLRLVVADLEQQSRAAHAMDPTWATDLARVVAKAHAPAQAPAKADPRELTELANRIGATEHLGPAAAFRVALARRPDLAHLVINQGEES